MATAVRNGWSPESLKARPGAGVFVATKAGRRLPQQTVAGYTYENLSGWIDRSLKNLEVETLDLVQLHGRRPTLIIIPRRSTRSTGSKTAGKIRDYGVSVERVEEALKAIEYPGVVSVQIIFKIFRLRPSELFFDAAKPQQRWHHRRASRSPPASSPASSRGTPSSPPTTTARSTVTARPSTRAKPSPASPSKPPSPPSKNSAPSARLGGSLPSPSSPSAGFRCSPPSPASIPAPRPRRRRAATLQAADLPPLSAADMADARRRSTTRTFRPHVHQRW